MHKCRRFEVRVVDWRVDAPAVNMAIIDNEVVFLAVTSDSVTRTGGIAVEEREVASHFSDYYRTLWNASTPLEKLLTDQSET
jgi:hypothetical protein